VREAGARVDGVQRRSLCGGASTTQSTIFLFLSLLSPSLVAVIRNAQLLKSRPLSEFLEFHFF